MPFLCLKNWSANAAHVRGRPRDRRRFKGERRAYAKTTCVAAISKQRRCGGLGRRGTFLGSAAALRSSYCSWGRSLPNVRHGKSQSSFKSLTAANLIKTWIWLPTPIKMSEEWNDIIPFCERVEKPKGYLIGSRFQGRKSVIFCFFCFSLSQTLH